LSGFIDFSGGDVWVFDWCVGVLCDLCSVVGFVLVGDWMFYLCLLGFENLWFFVCLEGLCCCEVKVCVDVVFVVVGFEEFGCCVVGIYLYGM